MRRQLHEKIYNESIEKDEGARKKRLVANTISNVQKEPMFIVGTHRAHYEMN